MGYVTIDGLVSCSLGGMGVAHCISGLCWGSVGCSEVITLIRSVGELAVCVCVGGGGSPKGRTGV